VHGACENSGATAKRAIDYNQYVGSTHVNKKNCLPTAMLPPTTHDNDNDSGRILIYAEYIAKALSS
jgi:hypothetical protein